MKRKLIIARRSVTAATILAIRGFLEYTADVKIMLKINNKEKITTGIKTPGVDVSLWSPHGS